MAVQLTAVAMLFATVCVVSIGAANAVAQECAQNKEDDMVLLQRTTVDERGSRERGSLVAEWPDLPDLDLDKLKKVASTVNAAATEATAKAVNGLVDQVNVSLDKVDAKVNTFGAGAVKVQHRFELDANDTLEVQVAKVVSLVNETMGKASTMWKETNTILKLSQSSVIGGLEAIGQDELATEVNQTIAKAVAQAVAVMHSVQATAVSAGNVASKEAAQDLRQLNASLAVGVAQVGKFVDAYEAYFNALTGGIGAKLDKLPEGARAKVNKGLNEIIGRANASAKNVARNEQMVVDGIVDTITAVVAKYDEVAPESGPLEKIKEFFNGLFR